MEKTPKKYKRKPRGKFIMTQAPVTAKIKVRLNDRTTVTIHRLSALKVWQVKYPDAYVIDSKVA